MGACTDVKIGREKERTRGSRRKREKRGGRVGREQRPSAQQRQRGWGKIERKEKITQGGGKATAAGTSEKK